MATLAPHNVQASKAPASNIPSRGRYPAYPNPIAPDDTALRRASAPARQVRESRASFGVASGSRGSPVRRAERSNNIQNTPPSRIVSTRSPIRSSDPGPRVGILPKSRKGSGQPHADLLTLPKVPPPTLLSSDQIAIMDRLAQVLDEDPEVQKPGASMVKRMIDEEKIHHLHAEEEEAARHADRDRKKVIKKDS